MSNTGGRPDSRRHFEESRAMTAAEMRAKLAVPAARYYVYGLVDPRAGDTFYIGKGTKLRALQHAKVTGKRNNSGKLAIIDQLAAAGLPVGYRLLGWFDKERDALDHERTLIAERRRSLTNIAAGGVGQSEVEVMEARKARGARLLAQMLPFDVWKARYNPGPDAELMYWRIKHELEKIAARGYVTSITVPLAPEEHKALVQGLASQVSP